MGPRFVRDRKICVRVPQSVEISQGKKKVSYYAKPACVADASGSGYDWDDSKLLGMEGRPAVPDPGLHGKSRQSLFSMGPGSMGLVVCL